MQLDIIPTADEGKRSNCCDLQLTLMIAAVSTISVMKVDMPFIWQSSAPTRARIASTSDISARSQGTKLPIWARSATTPTERMYVLLPPMLGPVMIWNVHSPVTQTASTPSQGSVAINYIILCILSLRCFIICLYKITVSVRYYK